MLLILATIPSSKIELMTTFSSNIVKRPVALEVFSTIDLALPQTAISRRFWILALPWEDYFQRSIPTS